MPPRELLAPPEGLAHVPPAFRGEVFEAPGETGGQPLLQPGQGKPVVGIDARDYQRARKDRKTMAHLPQGTLVAIAGGKDIANPAAVIERLDRARAKYADIF